MNLGAASAALVARNAENMARGTSGEEASVVNRSVGWLRRLVAADDPAVGGAALDRVEEAPDSHVRLHELAEVLNRRATADDGFRSDLAALINQARAEGIDISSITQLTWGKTTVRPPT